MILPYIFGFSTSKVLMWDVSFFSFELNTLMVFIMVYVTKKSKSLFIRGFIWYFSEFSFSMHSFSKPATVCNLINIIQTAVYFILLKRALPPKILTTKFKLPKAHVPSEWRLPLCLLLLSSYCFLLLLTWKIITLPNFAASTSLPYIPTSYDSFSISLHWVSSEPTPLFSFLLDAGVFLLCSLTLSGGSADCWFKCHYPSFFLVPKPLYPVDRICFS